MSRKKITIFITLFLLLMSTITANAYQLLGPRWPGSSYPITVTYKWGDYLQTQGTVARTAFENAVLDWNVAQGKIRFSHSSSSVNTLNTMHEASSSLYGRCTISYNGGNITSFTALINVGNFNISQANVARSVGNHELGHGIGLADVQSGTAIMNQNRNRTTIYRPQTDDVDGINALYN